MKNIALFCVSLITLAGCASHGNTDKSITVHGVTYDDQHWNGR